MESNVRVCAALGWSEKISRWKSRGARAPVPHSWRRQCWPNPMVLNFPILHFPPSDLHIFVVLHFPVINFTPIILHWSSFSGPPIFSQPLSPSAFNMAAQLYGLHDLVFSIDFGVGMRVYHWTSEARTAVRCLSFYRPMDHFVYSLDRAITASLFTGPARSHRSCFNHRLFSSPYRILNVTRAIPSSAVIWLRNSGS